MKITLAEWRKIAAAYKVAIDALGELENILTDLGFQHHRAGNHSEGEFLMRTLLPRVDDVVADLSRLDVNPQSEWMGGDSRDPKNFKYREPNCVPMPRQYLAEEGETEQ